MSSSAWSAPNPTSSPMRWIYAEHLWHPWSRCSPHALEPASHSRLSLPMERRSSRRHCRVPLRVGSPLRGEQRLRKAGVLSFDRARGKVRLVGVHAADMRRVGGTARLVCYGWTMEVMEFPALGGAAAADEVVQVKATRGGRQCRESRWRCRSRLNGAA